MQWIWLIILIIAIMGMMYCRWLVKRVRELEIEEFDRWKFESFQTPSPSSYKKNMICPICKKELDMTRPVNIIFVQSEPVFCCIKHTSKELANYKKKHIKITKQEKEA